MSRHCDGGGCEALHEQLTAWVDPSANPCDDFYAHVCGRWTANHSATAAGQAVVSPRTLRLRQMELRLMAEFKRGTADGSLRWLARLWDSCRKPEAEPRSKEVFDNILSEHGLLGFPFSSQPTSGQGDGDDLSSAAARVLALSGISAIVDVRVVKWHPKKKNSSRDWASARPRWLARIGAPEPLFRDFSRMGDVHDEWYLTAAQGIAGHRDMRGLFRVEQALVELAAHRRGAGDYARTTVARLAHAPHWNWTRFLGIVFRGIATFGRRTPVLVKGGSFQRQLAALISQFGPVHMLNYLAFRLHIQYAPFLERRPRFLTLAQLSAAWQPGWHDGDPPDDVSDLRCLRLMTSAVPELMAFVYWNGARPRGRKRDRSKQEAQRSRGFRDMTRHLVDWTVRTAPHELERAHGRERSRISSLLRAIELLRHQLFLPEWLHKSRLRMRFAELAFADAEESPLVSWRGLLASRKRNALLKIADRGFETFWEGSALRDTPWLDADEEYLAVPPGAVDARFDDPAFFIHHVPSLGVDLARLFASRLGRTAAHNRRASLRLRLDLLSDCLRRQHHSARPSSDPAAREDMLDLLALRVALHVFRHQVARGSRRFHMGAFSSGANVTYGTDQLFFYEFAMDRCEAYDEAYLQQRTVNGLRSPAPTLVNGPLRNLRTFARAFNCSRGSPMSPERICKL
ncbi:neprilysin-2-like [Amblyomma americanum]